MSDSTLYLYTSLTAGSSHIVTATARLETILKANKLPFRAIDVATDDAARKLWGRRSKGKKLPGLVKFGTVVGDLEEIEEWNEYGELRMQVNSVEDFGDSIPATSIVTTQPESAVSTPASEPSVPKQSTIKIQNPPAKESQKDDSITVALRQAGEEAATKAKESKAEKATPAAEQKQPLPPAVEEKKEGGADSVRRKSSVAPEIVEGANPKRPPLVPEVAAVSSANFHADNAEALGLVEHHRGSIVSATSPEEKAKVAQDIRKSISGGHAEMLESLRDDQAQKAGQEETIDEESESGEAVEDAMNRKAKKPGSS
ncbi:hypothetical protein F9C07_2232115 [Aspergillus flavus]|uniref:Uncharacterized protein n=1 Tax=Aspergillus flavus (strain ATCC 200026 / FGSC A1120 / IAM 13836 / NRRL 3357 / JCM 12722 / SRRC 167) TaxID=332952 RepID=A0A7G5K4N0_ASPFN|nr:uncharacterized protein G4B84_006150 [Aspergillus flavus NRRL3357]KAJ1710515.1 hypothetical protein NYO67_7327 [Aspergillus flavus]KAF7625144.1 hypothetical protein AFLA_002018 [Aspergillus flavus NRRL3357]QMW30769.1 hypothetical protein G4B84_006150 [Aspergillus flavus NRRL3357]QMW42822.1 hypothetical protein G4B11_006192 [Aspergillus flavus]QRD89657.1 hypothetical protein F9C07_2232115 [Aspergillus flavus]